MENKKIDVVFGLLVIAFLLIVIIVIKDINAKRTNDHKEYMATVTNIVKQKNTKIKVLGDQLAAKQKEIDDLKNTLAQTKNSLESLSDKLTPPVPVQ